METHTFFIQLLVILLAARLLAEIAVRINVPAVIGELAAGIILGPSLLGYLEPNEVIRLLAEIGIILLLFEVGLETDVRRIMRTGHKSFLVALMGFFVPFVLGFAASYWLFELSVLVALFVGGTLTATSIGITVRVLADVNRQNENEGQIVLGAAVL
ncbi:MAG: cation:proton antiporter, partial [Gammaproteobacteria bacterium]|nr:cation:proton antiporter [Gammaproteobacteria bacterium]